MNVCFCVLSKIPNDSLDCPLLAESFPVFTYIFQLNACIRIFLIRIDAILQGVNNILSVCIYIYMRIHLSCAKDFTV